jgi:hypothetical protein
MRLSTRLTTLAITAFALTGTLGAQQHTNARPAAAHSQAPRGHVESRARPDMRAQHNAPARADVRGRVEARGDFRGRPDVRNDFRGREGFRAIDDHRVPVAAHGRPLITRGGYVPARVYGGSVYGGPRFSGVARFGGLPLGWDRRVVFHGFFPVSYGGYCQPVPVDYDYMLPPMAPSYDPCLFGDRVIVYDRFSRNIVFAATL